MTDEQWQTAWKLYQSGSSVPAEQLHDFFPAFRYRSPILPIRLHLEARTLPNSGYS